MMINDVIDDTEDDEYLSDHTRSMRAACDYCIKLFRRFDEGTNANANRMKVRSIFRKGLRGSDELRRLSKEHRTRRKNAYRAFWASTQPNPSSDHSDRCRSPPRTPASNQIEGTGLAQIKTIHVLTSNNDDSVEEISVDQVRCFKDRFQNLNVPCLINGLDRSPHFRFVNEHWRNNSSVEPNDSAHSEQIPSKVNRKWFRDELGDGCLVPLRYSPLRGETDDPDSHLSLDEDGRAMECETKEVPVKAWIDMLETSHKLPQKFNTRRNNSNGHDIVDEGGPNTIIYYLKDWHLQQSYPPTAEESTVEDSFVRNSICSLYSVPQFFGHDLLNSFLTRFTKGDYRFCYWGPSLSFTARHSDVMHSFSWSYNVVGTKEWTFYRSSSPASSSHGDDETKHRDDQCHGECEAFTVIQETGQTIFVPAMWQHKVVNLEETISINHNWITTANLDLVWDCLMVEMVAIQNELRGWECGSSDSGDENGLDQNMEACENMLRGCIGLDVTGFVLMTLVGLLEAVAALLLMPWPNVETLSGHAEGTGGNMIFSNKLEELVFDAIRLASVLRDVSTTEKQLIRLRSRLSDILQSHDMAQQVEIIVNDLIEWIQIN